jgi:hypothetical protein
MFLMITDSLNDYISHLQLLAFFAGYPFVYTLVNFLATKRQEKTPFISKEWVALLPFTYALIGSLFFGLLLKNISPDFSLQNIADTSSLEVWAIISVLFWIPALSKKPVFSLLHSVPFFLILIKDFFIQATSNSAMFVIENDMKMYSISFLLNTVALVFIYALLYCLRYFRISKNTTLN